MSIRWRAALHCLILMSAASIAVWVPAPSGAAPADAPDTGVLGPPSDPADGAALAVDPAFAIPPLDLLWVPAGILTLDAAGKPRVEPLVPPAAMAGPPNALEEAKLAQARAAEDAARQAGISTAQRSASAKEPISGAGPIVLRPDPAACVLSVPAPRQEAGKPGLTEGEQAKRGNGGAR